MQAELPPGTEMADTDAACREVVPKLKASMAAH
jgi:hypothetical protein